MSNVTEVNQLDDRHLHWKANVGGREQEWAAVIREQVPDEKIIWESEIGSRNAGIVSFEPLAPNRTRVLLQMSYQPEGLVERVGDAIGMLDRSVAQDLENFKHFIEDRGSATGAYRAEIPNPDAPTGHTQGRPFGATPPNEP
jgi:uncharacterized membrane protein